MKKYFLLSIIAIVAVALAAFTGYKTLSPKKTTGISLLDENIEALTNGEVGETLWVRKDGNCVYEATGKAGSTVKLNLGGTSIITLKLNSDGYVKYVATDAQTDCTAGGKQQCQARYCPVAFWQ
jgi:hypothetical protein